MASQLGRTAPSPRAQALRRKPNVLSHHLRHSATRPDRFCDELLVFLLTAAASLRRRHWQGNVPRSQTQQLLGRESMRARTPPRKQKAGAPHTGVFADAQAEAAPHLRKVLPVNLVRRCSIVHWHEDFVGQELLGDSLIRVRKSFHVTRQESIRFDLVLLYLGQN